MKEELLKAAILVAGGVLGSIAQETLKSSVDIDDSLVSGAAAAGTLFLATKVDGNMKNLALGASTVMGMNALSEVATTMAQKSSNPTIDKLAELLPRVSAPNVLANPNVDIPVENIEDTSLLEEGEDLPVIQEQGVNGFGKVDYASLVA